ncbi:hypothetical protein BV898_13823 [Hypsibius exemplaris]|uniref:Uncharacterized protein n=1 Tax=Hypsibius exemplaris TaxID=2072580 RepID=A0A1W0W9I0_HYPEX|nr:hypothetical protein BV898_13823 [Hypsibius exemplaris]
MGGSPQADVETPSIPTDPAAPDMSVRFLVRCSLNGPLESTPSVSHTVAITQCSCYAATETASSGSGGSGLAATETAGSGGGGGGSGRAATETAGSGGGGGCGTAVATATGVFGNTLLGI